MCVCSSSSVQPSYFSLANQPADCEKHTSRERNGPPIKIRRRRIFNKRLNAILETQEQRCIRQPLNPYRLSHPRGKEANEHPGQPGDPNAYNPSQLVQRSFASTDVLPTRLWRRTRKQPRVPRTPLGRCMYTPVCSWCWRPLLCAPTTACSRCRG